ncbi:MAG: sulfur carrier protein ThiS [Nitrospirae bacterium]|nr:sulfur carrier protein ThiS [Nitrospirota bacterium]MCL5284170.1 sulfur carrier protein ThiS [Nitrospirota bacterium]
MPSITVNGERKPIEEGTTLQALVGEMGFLDRAVVCEVNMTILSKKDWEKVLLREGDAVEIIGFVGGGSLLPVFSKGD